MNAPARQVQHTNPYHKDNEKEKHDLFEAAWSKKTSFGNFIGMWESGRKSREARVKLRVESFTAHRDAFVTLTTEISQLADGNRELLVPKREE